MPRVEFDNRLSLKDVLLFTYESPKFRNRVKYMVRDVLKTITIEKVRSFDAKFLNDSERTKFRVVSFSYPQYKPYIDLKGSTSKTQRKVKHQYDQVLMMPELNLNAPFKYRLGSLKKWESKPSQAQVQTVYTETRAKWKKESEKKFKTKKEQADYVREKVEKHKKSAKYIDVGDYNSRVLGINGDFYFRFMVVYKNYGLLYDKDTTNQKLPLKTNPKMIPAMPKHFIRLIDVLLKRGVLKK